MKRKIKKKSPLKELFSGWTVLFLLVFYYAVNATFLSMITKNYLISFIVAAPAAYICFKAISLVHKKIENRMLILQELNKYTTSVTFYLNAGHNVLDALRDTLALVHPILQKDINKTLETLSQKAILDTTHFQKYHLTSLDLFHQTLLVKYDKGGQSREIFAKPFQAVQFEISEIDDLCRKKQATAKQVYMMIFFACLISLAIAFMPGDTYQNFLDMPISIFVLLAFYGSLLFNLFRLQKDKADISLRY